ncbi:MAG: hypothetical protein PUD93_05840, partial [Lachnospiraceae bacterium]|nr:hypothetical protein [Lachnospiraceae bacterium]
FLMHYIRLIMTKPLIPNIITNQGKQLSLIIHKQFMMNVCVIIETIIAMTVSTHTLVMCSVFLTLATIQKAATILLNTSLGNQN